MDDHVRLLLPTGGLILAECLPPDGSRYRWTLRPRGAQAERELVVRDQPGAWLRTQLAYIGATYMGGQLHGGYARRLLASDGLFCPCAFFMSNEALSGLWVRVYSAGPIPPRVA